MCVNLAARGAQCERWCWLCRKLCPPHVQIWSLAPYFWMSVGFDSQSYKTQNVTRRNAPSFAVGKFEKVPIFSLNSPLLELGVKLQNPHSWKFLIVPVFIFAKSGSYTLNPQLFTAKTNFGKFWWKPVVVVGAAVTDPYMSRRQLLSPVCLVLVYGLPRCVHWIVSTSGCQPKHKGIGTKKSRKIGSSLGCCLLSPCSRIANRPPYRIWAFRLQLPTKYPRAYYFRFRRRGVAQPTSCKKVWKNHKFLPPPSKGLGAWNLASRKGSPRAPTSVKIGAPICTRAEILVFKNYLPLPPQNRKKSQFRHMLVTAPTSIGMQSFTKITVL